MKGLKMADKIKFKSYYSEHVLAFVSVLRPFFCCMAPAPVSVDVIFSDDGGLSPQSVYHTLSSIGDFQFILTFVSCVH